MYTEDPRALLHFTPARDRTAGRLGYRLRAARLKGAAGIPLLTTATGASTHLATIFQESVDIPCPVTYDKTAAGRVSAREHAPPEGVVSTPMSTVCGATDPSKWPMI